MDQHTMFTTGSFRKILIHMCLPVIAIILIMLLYNIADIFFIGQTGNAMMVAALTQASPVFSILLGLGSMIGTGGCTAISTALGEGRRDKVRSYTACCCVLSILIAVLFSIILLVFMEPILKLLGATSETAGYARTYLTIIAWFSPFFLFPGSMANIVRAEGAAKESMIGNMLGTVINLILDPILILVFHMDVAGAAIATVIANIVSSVYYLRYLCNPKSQLRFGLRDLTLKPAVSLPIFSYGLPSSVSTLLTSISSVFGNQLLLHYGENTLAASGISGKITLITIMLQMGLCMGIQPVLAYNYGARNLSRIRELVTKIGILIFVIGCVLSFSIFCFRNSLVLMFIKDPSVNALGLRFLLAGLITGPFCGFYQLAISFLQSTGKPSLSTLLSILKDVILYVPILYLMDLVFGLTGLVYAGTVSTILATLIGVAMAVQRYYKLRTAYTG